MDLVGKERERKTRGERRKKERRSKMERSGKHLLFLVRSLWSGSKLVDGFAIETVHFHLIFRNPLYGPVENGRICTIACFFLF